MSLSDAQTDDFRGDGRRRRRRPQTKPHKPITLPLAHACGIIINNTRSVPKLSNCNNTY